MVKLPKLPKIGNIKLPKMPGGNRYNTVGEWARETPKDLSKRAGRATRALSGDYSGVQEQLDEMGTDASKAADNLTGSTSKKKK